MRKITISSSEDPQAAGKRPTEIRYQVVHFYGSGHPAPASGTGWVPPVDVFETETDVILEVNLGGVASDQVEIRIEGQAIQLSGERLEYGKSGQRCYHIMEIERGNFLRVVPLPAMVDAPSALAEFHHGLLVLTLQKKKSGPLHGCWQADSMEGLE